jgi:hypothetical protein
MALRSLSVVIYLDPQDTVLCMARNVSRLRRLVPAMTLVQGGLLPHNGPQ